MMKKIYTVSVLSFFLILTSLYAGSGKNLQITSAGWKAGVARGVITPEQPMWMAGYASRDHPAEGTLHDLWVKVLVLEDEAGKKAVLITSDILGFPKNISDRLRNRLLDKYGFTKDRIILNSSHTHTGPVLQDALFDMYSLDNNELIKIKQYSIKLENRIIEIVGKALNSMQPVKVYSQNGVTRFQVNRRNNSESTLNQLTSLNGPNDYAVPVLKVISETGDLLAIAFGYACHATVLSSYNWSGDYPGFAQIELEKLHPGTTALFFQCAGADLNPLPRRTVALAQQYGRELAAAVDRVLNEEMKLLSPSLQTAYSEVELSFAEIPTRDELIKSAAGSKGFEKQWAERMLKEIEAGKTFITHYPFPVEIWKLGEQTIISLGGELVVEYSIRLKQIFGRDIFILGYSNDVMSYIPSARIIKEGGYEGESSQKVYGLPAGWKTDIEETIIHEVIRLAESVGVNQVSSTITK